MIPHRNTGATSIQLRPRVSEQLLQFLENNLKTRGQPLCAEDSAAFSPRGARAVERLLSHCPAYRATPTWSMPALAGSLGVGEIAIKDESSRLGLGSFKALGGAYAVIDLVLSESSKQLGRRVDATDLLAAEVRHIAASITVGCATDGNHGRSVAAGAHLCGCRSVIFLHEGVSHRREIAISRLGAEIRRVPGSFDDSVAVALTTCVRMGWHVVSDTSWPGYESIPRKIMQGYTVLMHEALNHLRSPTHIFVQAGVGGLAAAVAAYATVSAMNPRPKIVVVEPIAAACILESARRGQRAQVAQQARTVMAMLECYEPSLIAWNILCRVADVFVGINDEAAIASMRRLARPLGGDPPIVAGESGAVGLAALISCVGDRSAARGLGLSAHSRVLLFNTEGATDPELYTRLTEVDPAAVSAAQEAFQCVRLTSQS
jgi:diaminopropionate ammonia-lyase